MKSAIKKCFTERNEIFQLIEQSRNHNPDIKLIKSSTKNAICCDCKLQPYTVHVEKKTQWTMLSSKEENIDVVFIPCHWFVPFLPIVFDIRNIIVTQG